MWDIEEGTKMCSNYNAPSQITSAKFINSHDITFLLIVSGESCDMLVMSYDVIYTQRMDLCTCGRTTTVLVQS